MRTGTDKALDQVLLAMCDVQLLTGTGILLSGYIGLHCYISSYHWHLVVYLAWFSNLTHIACLTSLRRYLHQHQLERNWRLFFMTVLWAGLIPAIVPTAFFNWATQEPTASHPWTNARCFFDLRGGLALLDGTALTETMALQSATVSILLLAFNYFGRVIKLTKGLSHTVHVTIRRGTSDRYTRSLVKRINKIATNPRPSVTTNSRLSIAVRRALNLVLIKAPIALYLVAKLYADFLTSDASDVSSRSCPSATKFGISQHLLTSPLYTQRAGPLARRLGRVGHESHIRDKALCHGK